MKTYTITLYDSKGKLLPESFTVEHDGNVGAEFKKHYTRHAKLFVNNNTETIQVN